jgi:hypothetical protein
MGGLNYNVRVGKVRVQIVGRVLSVSSGSGGTRCAGICNSTENELSISRRKPYLSNPPSSDK